MYTLRQVYCDSIEFRIVYGVYRNEYVTEETFNAKILYLNIHLTCACPLHRTAPAFAYSYHYTVPKLTYNM